MSRLPRFFLPDTPQHVIQRGNNREAMYRSPTDFAFYKGCLEYAARKHDVAVHAYVLMTNHVHLLATPSEATCLPRMMQAVGRVYVQYFNRTYTRTGTLWEGRYKATIVDSDSYLLGCMRYIELNPVRAGMAVSPTDYAWSSFHSNAHGVVDPLITPHPVFRGLGRSRVERQAAYRAMFGTPLAGETVDAIRDTTQHAWALGDARFNETVSACSRRAGRLPKGAPPKRSP
ncbi:MAG: transposase [Betaproteobacteria bacterium]|jgi:putative transposase|nr:transposase [Betaproteobacteria bacterium]